MKRLESKLLLTGLLVAVVTACGVSCSPSAARPGDLAYAVLGDDLEPFRSDFNASPDDVRAVLLVGPT